MILLTGASGFIGSKLLSELIDKYGSDYVSAFTSKPINGVRCILHNGYKGGLKQYDELLRNVSVVIHAGAYIPKNSANSNLICENNENIINTEFLLRHKYPCLKKIIYISTSDVYDQEVAVINENARENPSTLYGHSKLYCEKMVGIWCSKNHVQYNILRIGHVYGPGEEKYKKLIPVAIKRVLSEDPVTIYNAGNDIRTFIYIDDVVRSIVKSIDINLPGEIINVVGSEKISIKNLVYKIFKIANKQVRVENVSANIVRRNIIFDNTKLTEILSSPKITLDEGLELEINYFKNL